MSVGDGYVFSKGNKEGTGLETTALQSEGHKKLRPKKPWGTPVPRHIRRNAQEPVATLPVNNAPANCMSSATQPVYTVGYADSAGSPDAASSAAQSTTTAARHGQAVAMLAERNAATMFLPHATALSTATGTTNDVSLVLAMQPATSSQGSTAYGGCCQLSASSILRLRDNNDEAGKKAMQRLPLNARILVRLVRDVPTVLQLVTAFGGTTVYIPTERSAQVLARHPLRSTLSLQQLRSLVKYFSGTDIYIPRCVQAITRLRNIQIVQLFSKGIAEGASAKAMVRNLALKYGLSDRWIWSILKTTEL